MSSDVPLTVDEKKMGARDSRLKLKNSKEEILRKELLLSARQACKDKSIEFGKCAKEQGLAVVFRCREQNQASKWAVNLNLSMIQFFEQ